MPSSETGSWYALNTRFRYEAHVARHLQSRGFEVFFPAYSSRRRWSDRVKEIELPLFPGYLFCRFHADHRLPILTAPGMVQIVSAGKIPLPVDESEIGAVQNAVRHNLSREPWPYLRIGERVRVECGPMRGAEGILLHIKGGHRLVVSVTLLQRSVALELSTDWIVSASQKAPVVRPASVPAA